MAYIVPGEIPKVCLDCPFRAMSDYIPVENGLYKKITRKEEWCPLKEVR